MSAAKFTHWDDEEEDDTPPDRGGARDPDILPLSAFEAARAARIREIRRLLELPCHDIPIRLPEGYFSEKAGQSVTGAGERRGRKPGSRYRPKPISNRKSQIQNP